MAKWTRIARARMARLAADRRGGVAVLTAMSLTTLMGFAGLGTEASLWYVTKRNMQAASDAAAYSAAVSEKVGQSTTAFTAAATAVAAKYGYTNGTGSVVVTVNNPPKSGPNTGNAQAIEVLISQPQHLLFSALLISTAPTITSRAVAAPATTGGSAGTGCVMALDKGAVSDVSDSGTAALNLNGCSIYVNSSASNALNLSGSASINALSASIVGNYTTSGSATLTTTDGVATGQAATPDPYASLNVPSYGACNQNSYSLSRGTTTIGPSVAGGVYVLCNGLSLSGSANLTLNPGVYIVNGGNFNISGTSTITGTGVTIILTGSGSSYGTVNISGGTTTSITAPTTGATAGIAFYGDRNGPTTNTSSFSGGTTENITGAIYFPTQKVDYSGGSTTASASKCTQLIGYQLSFSGSTNFENNCTGVGVSSIGGSAGATTTTQLVE